MVIYGVALLAFCFLVGKILGTLLGAALHFNGDIGGVGFAMILLILSNAYLQKKGWLKPPTNQGLVFWSAMYIPIIVAMAATQNVKAALSGGSIALLAGTIATLAAFWLVPLLSRIGRKPSPQKTEPS